MGTNLKKWYYNNLTTFLFYTVTPVLLKSDTNKDCIDHLLYEIPIAVDDDEQEQLMLNQINTILHQLLRLTRTEINKILPLESFVIIKDEDYYEIKLIIPFCQTLKKYINNTQLSDDEIMFFTADLLQLVTMCIDHNRVGIFFFDDLYIRRDPSSPIPSVYVSPLLYLLPILHKYIYEDVTLTAIPPDGYADANLNETTITWSLGVVVHQLVTGLNPFNSNYPNELIMNQKDNINQFYQIAIQQLLTAPQRMSPLDIQTLPLFQTCLNYKYFNSSDIRNYKPIQHLGKGMTGIVFSAETTDNQIVAIKESKESAFPIMFREARVSRLCDHPKYCKIY
ncbi:Protein kinase domain-containing protein [Entamoeba marina]